MARVILWAVLIMVVVRALSRLARGVLEGAGYNRTPARSSVSLVRDPVCGVFVAPANALTSGSGQATKYFCSEKCRRSWTGVSIPNSATPNSQ
jgi:YHS domain-containing protein